MRRRGRDKYRPAQAREEAWAVSNGWLPRLHDLGPVLPRDEMEERIEAMIRTVLA